MPLSEDTFFRCLKKLFFGRPHFASVKRVNPANPVVTMIDPVRKNTPAVFQRAERFSNGVDIRNERLYNDCFKGDTLSSVAE